MTDNNWKVKINYVHIYVISTLDIQLLLFLFFFPFIATPFIKWNRVTPKGGEMQKGIFES